MAMLGVTGTKCYAPQINGYICVCEATPKHARPAIGVINVNKHGSKSPHEEEEKMLPRGVK